MGSNPEMYNMYQVVVEASQQAAQTIQRHLRCRLEGVPATGKAAKAPPANKARRQSTEEPMLPMNRGNVRDQRRQNIGRRASSQRVGGGYNKGPLVPSERRVYGS